MGDSYKLGEKLWAQFVLAAGPVNTEVAWFVTKFWWVPQTSGITSSHSRFTLLFSFKSILSTGLLPQNLQFEERGLHANVGEVPYQSGCSGRYRQLRQWWHTRVLSARVSCDCCGWFSKPRCCFWWVGCVGRHLRRLFGKWVQSQAGREPNIWSASFEAMPAKGIFFRLWVFESLLVDVIFCHALEEGRASRLDDVTFESSSCHHFRKAVDAVASWGRQQQCGSVATHRGLP